MKKSIIINSILSLAAVFGLAACDTDVDHFIANVDAPVLKSTSPSDSEILKPGNDTIKLTFDKNIFFYSGNASQITLNGESVKSAYVLGSDSVLTIVADVPSSATCSLNIPAGLITGPTKSAAASIDVSWTGVEINIASAPVNADADASTVALYNTILSNYGSKMITGAMADVAWNHTPADHVYSVTGKYPAINCFDYIFLPYSPANWINYNDITPVKEWHDGGGIVACMWHWIVPKYEDTVMSTTETGMASDWSGNLQLTDAANKAIFANASIGDKIVVNTKDVKSGAQGSFKNSSWAGLTDDNNKSYDYFDISGTSFSITLDATTLAAVKDGGVIISGHDYTLESVYLVSGNYTYSTQETSFKASNCLVDGTWENKVMKSDMAKIASHLKDLQSAGISVLWRPLHEAAGNIPTGGESWFWWGNSGNEALINLWRYMYTYFKEQGLNNLIWVWTGDESCPDWYPGDAYVDVVGADIYKNTTASTFYTKFLAMQTAYPHKMITMSECGGISNIPDIWTAGGKFSWFMPWYNSTDVTHATDEWWQNAMSSDNVITRDQLAK